MTMRTLIDAATLLARVTDATTDATAAPVVIDVGFDLADPAAGEAAWRAGHVPGSIHLHLERDLCGPRVASDGAFRGRHPLPERSAFAAVLGRVGVRPGREVVALDAQGGIFTARLWWMLRWMGHAEVSVLDGGRAAWVAAGGRLVADDGAETAVTDLTPAANAGPPYPDQPPGMPTIDAAALGARLGRHRLIDARAPERFRGDVEPIDRVAGHIPGALNRFYQHNLGPDGGFKSPSALTADWTGLLGGGAPADVIHQCGSGVTACHNLLAMAHAGLGDGTLYPGSWSEWSADPARPVARG